MRKLSVSEIMGVIVLPSTPTTIGVRFGLDQSMRVGDNISHEEIGLPLMKAVHTATTNENVSGTGTVVHVGLEGGFYGIISDNGSHYDPTNLSTEFQVDGLRVKFVVRILHIVTFHMWGIPVSILEIEKLATNNNGNGTPPAGYSSQLQPR